MTKNFLEIKNVTFAASEKNKVNNVSLILKMKVILFVYWDHLELAKLQYLELLLV